MGHEEIGVGIGGRSALPRPTLGPMKLGRRWGTEKFIPSETPHLKR